MKQKLGNFEKAMALTAEFSPFNAVIILRITNGPAEETLGNVLEYLRRRHPLLGVHILKEKGGYFFVSEGTPGIPLRMVERQNSRQWLEVAEEELNKGFDIDTGPPVRVTYLTGSDGKKENEILITFHHAVMDAPSGVNFLHEMLSLCAKMDVQAPVEEDKNLEPLPPAETFFPPAFKGFRRGLHNFLFMVRQMGDEFRFQWGTRGRRKPPVHPSGKCKVLTMTFSPETTEALSKRSRKKRVTLNNLFNAAILMAVHKHLYEGRALPMRNFNFADLRRYLVPPLDTVYLGSYFSMMRFTVGMKENPEVWELAREVNDITYASFKKGDKFCSNLLSYMMMRAILRFKSFRMGTTAMSFTGPVMLKKQYGKIEVRDIHAFVSNFSLGPEYSAQVRLFDRQIYWDILYLDSDMDREQAEVIAGEIRTILESAAEEDM